MTTNAPSVSGQTSYGHARFTWSISVAGFDVPEAAFARANRGCDHVAVGAIVFNVTGDRVLLVQRSANDSLPGLWEVPGGMCDGNDETILHSVARELREESCLRAKFIKAQAGSHSFSLGGGRQACKYFFVTEVENHDVQLDADEHQRFVWATKEEVQSKRCGDIELDFTSQTTQDVIAGAFKIA